MGNPSRGGQAARQQALRAQPPAATPIAAEPEAAAMTAAVETLPDTTPEPAIVGTAQSTEAPAEPPTTTTAEVAEPLTPVEGTPAPPADGGQADALRADLATVDAALQALHSAPLQVTIVNAPESPTVEKTGDLAQAQAAVAALAVAAEESSAPAAPAAPPADDLPEDDVKQVAPSQPLAPVPPIGARIRCENFEGMTLVGVVHFSDPTVGEFLLWFPDLCRFWPAFSVDMRGPDRWVCPTSRGAYSVYPPPGKDAHFDLMFRTKRDVSAGQPPADPTPPPPSFVPPRPARRGFGWGRVVAHITGSGYDLAGNQKRLWEPGEHAEVPVAFFQTSSVERL